MSKNKATSFEDFYKDVQVEAAAEGAEAVRDLHAKEVKYALVNALIGGRHRLNLTQAELADRSGVAQTEISRIERGRKSPTIDTYSRLIAAMGLRFTPPRPRAGRSRSAA